jgi:hypothetical protein
MAVTNSFETLLQTSSTLNTWTALHYYLCLLGSCLSAYTPNSHILFYNEELYMVGRGYIRAEQSVRKGVDRSYNTYSYTQTSAAHCSLCLQITGQIHFIDTKSSGGETDSILAWHAISHPDRHVSLALFSCLPKQLLYLTNPWQYNTKV